MENGDDEDKADVALGRRKGTTRLIEVATDKPGQQSHIKGLEIAKEQL
jgi:hypothetical protein